MQGINQLEYVEEAEPAVQQGSKVQKLLQIIAQRGAKGISLQELLEASGMQQKAFAQHVKDLKIANRIEVDEVGGRQVVRVADAREVVHLQQMRLDLASRERGGQLFEVYEKIFRYRGRGVEKKELQAQLVRIGAMLTQLLKELEKSTYIYSRKSKKMKSKRKLFLCKMFKFEEDVEQGVLFKEGECDTELLAQLTEELKRMFSGPHLSASALSQQRAIKNSKLIDRAEIATRLKMSCSLPLEERDIEKLLNIWQFDELIEKVSTVVGNSDKISYKLVAWEDVDNSIVYKPPLTKMPCGNCPVRTECRIGHKISPENCIYFNNIADW